ncbi:hydroxymethylbilane synthase [Thermaurantiacus sp.]
MPSPLRLGSRASPLARAQTGLAAAALEAAGSSSLSITVDTLGDRVRDRPLAELGGKAVWTKELDEALLDGRIDAAVHSLKDVETRLPDGLVLAAVLRRADPRDRLIGAPTLRDLPAGARVGTSSPRRAAQLRARRPDVEPVLLRGNVATRLARVAEGAVEATFLAAAGLDRLGVEVGTPLPLEDWLPAASQGIVGITARRDDPATCAALAAIDHAPTHLAAIAERGVLAAIGGSCRTAMAVHARPLAGSHWRLDAELLSPDGAECVSATEDATLETHAEARALAERVAARLVQGMTDAIRASLQP